MTSAARVGDPIEHSEALNGLLLGLAVGAAAVVVAAAVGVSIVASGGLAAVAVVGAVVSLSAGVGELIGSLSYCTNTAGHISKGSSNVFINGRPAARAHLDTAECDKHGQVPQVIAEGSSTVYINGQPAARVGDRTICDGKISAGSDNVYIGGETEQTDDINPEVPGWLHGVVLGIGFGSAVVLTSWATAIVGFIGGAMGGYGGGVIGGRRYGEGSDEQKVMAFGGAFIGGSLAGKGQQWFDSRYEFKTQGLGSLFGNIKVVPKSIQATFGHAKSTDYRKTFFEEYPDQRGKVIVHHAVEQQVEKFYPGLVKSEELHSIENLRGIPKELNSKLHLSAIRKEWNRFYSQNKSPTKQQLLDKATEIDKIYGSQFTPPIEE
ncbi:PAAR domain-containing protein [Pseudomonas syringae USA007]|uniref:PAAR domain-containing protein n=1 Tax=Pseudomonas syringae USA007 TaxID=1357288 RepID=A0AAU8M7W1_PSESX|nr:PAAR domain-containing protein [Pseudomonas syringae]